MSRTPTKAPGDAQRVGVVLLAIGGIYAAQGLVGGIAFQGVPAVLRHAGASLDQVGLAYLALLPWALKFLWAPALERLRLPPGMTARRTRVIVVSGQWLMGVTLAGLAMLVQPPLPALLAAIGLLALIAASVDIACDGYAVEQLASGRRGWGNAAQVGGSYLGMFAGAGLFLLLVASHGWATALLAMAALVWLLSVPFALAGEPARSAASALAHRPSLAFAWQRRGVRLGLLATVLFEAGVRMAYGMTAPMLLDHGASLATVGWMSGAGGVAAGIAGTLTGGLLVHRLGARRAVLLAASVQTMALLALWAAVAIWQLPLPWLLALVLIQSLCMAIGFVALYSFLMDRASLLQAGVDFTLFQCADAMTAAVFGMAASMLAQRLGYGATFGIAATLGVAAVVLLPALTRRAAFPEPQSNAISQGTLV